MGINNPELHGSAIPIELALRYAQSETGDESDSVAEPPVPEEKPEFVKPAPPKLGTTSKKVSFKNLAHSVVRQISIQDIEKEQVELCPKVEGRIFQYDEQVCIQGLFRNRLFKGIQTTTTHIILFRIYLSPIS